MTGSGTDCAASIIRKGRTSKSLTDFKLNQRGRPPVHGPVSIYVQSKTSGSMTGTKHLRKIGTHNCWNRFW